MSKRRSSLEVAQERQAVAEARLAAFRAKQRLEMEKRAYDAATPSKYFPQRGDTRSADAVNTHAGDKLRKWARYLDENLDLATGALDSIIDRTVGNGIDIDPLVERPDGTPAKQVNIQIRRRLDEFLFAEVETTGELSWLDVQRLLMRSYLRDGEVFINYLEGPGAFDHQSDTPFTLELVEADHCPIDLNQGSAIVHGVEKNSARRPIAYHLYAEHPGDRFIGVTPSANTVRMPAEQMTHLKLVRRLGQTRGITIFHPVLQRLEDVKDYEESERIAARVAASFTAYIRKGDNDPNPTLDSAGDRLLEMAPGMILDDLLPGEEIGTIDTNRPNTALQDYRNSQLRAVAAGVGVSYSALSKDYNGTYSSQRQELVESMPAYGKVRAAIIDKFMRPFYRRWLRLEVLSGRIQTAGANLDTIFDAEFVPPGMPWIEPLKEIQADVLAIDNDIKSRHTVIRERGGNPQQVDKQNEQDEVLIEKKQRAEQIAEGANQEGENDDADERTTN